MAATSCIDEATARRVARGEADPAESQAVRLHARDCRACATVLDEAFRPSQPSNPPAGDAPDPEPTATSPHTLAPPRQPPPAEPGAGTRIGRYLTLAPLGEGGHGQVFAAYDLQLERKVALKLLHPDAADADPAGSAARLLREAQAMAQLSHPNVVAVHDFGAYGQGVYLAMEYVEGGDVHRWLRKGERSVSAILDVFVAAGRGLAAAHAKGIVHRDFKPANVLIGASGVVRITDFGIAHAEAKPSLSEGKPTATPYAGKLAGTPGYMAPEQLTGQRATAKSDQFSFAVSLWQALYGKRPFDGISLEEQLEAIRACAVQPEPAGTKVPARLRRVLLRALSENPEARWPSLDALLAALVSQPWRRARRFAPAAVGLAALAAVGGLFARSALSTRRLCAEAGAPLAGVWNEARRAAVQAGLRATGHARAEATSAAVGGLLDRYARDWAAMATQACEAAHVRGEESPHVYGLRSACLDRRRAELDAVAGLLARADAAFADRAAQVASSLLPVSTCGDVRALEGLVEPPVDPEVRAEVARLEEELGRARLQRVGGQFKEAGAALEALRQAAEKVGYRPLQARIALQRGLLFEETDDLKRAQDSLFTAVARAEAGNDRATLAAAASRMMYVMSQSLESAADSLAWGELAAAALEGLGVSDPALEADVHSDRCAAYLVLQKPALALAEGTRAVELRRRAYGEEHYLYARAVNNEGVALARTGRKAEGIARVREAIALAEPIIGSDHPQTLLYRTNVVFELRILGRFEEAAADAADVVARAERSLGPEHRITGHSRWALARLHADLGSLDRAEQEAKALLEACRRSSPRGNLTMAALFLSGALRLARGQVPEALALMEQGASLMASLPGAYSAEMLEELVELGDAYAAARRWPEAIAAYQKAIDAPQPELHEPRFAGRARLRLAYALWESGGDQARARSLAAEAAGVFDRAAFLAPQAAEARRWLAGHEDPK